MEGKAVESWGEVVLIKSSEVVLVVVEVAEAGIWQERTIDELLISELELLGLFK